MQKRTGLLLLGGGIVLALGVAVSAAFLTADAADEPPTSAAPATETIIDPYRQWGTESGSPGTGRIVIQSYNSAP